VRQGHGFLALGEGLVRIAQHPQDVGQPHHGILIHGRDLKRQLVELEGLQAPIEIGRLLQVLAGRGQFPEEEMACSQPLVGQGQVARLLRLLRQAQGLPGEIEGLPVTL